MNDERFLRDWLRDVTDSAADPKAAADKVVRGLPATRQRRRWLPWPLARRRRRDDSNPTVSGRTRSMLSPVKVLTGAALAALVSVSFLASRPFDAGPGSTQNAAELDPSLAAFATGTIIESTSPIDSNGTVVPGTGLVRTEGIHYTNRWETDDPRLTGIATYDAEWFRFPQSDFQVEAATHVLENADGRWVGQGTALAKWGSTNTDIAIMHGEGAYDGLTAYVLMDWTVQPPAITAAIFPGVMPRSPEPLSE